MKTVLYSTVDTTGKTTRSQTVVTVGLGNQTPANSLIGVVLIKCVSGDSITRVTMCACPTPSTGLLSLKKYLEVFWDTLATSVVQCELERVPDTNEGSSIQRHHLSRQM